MFWVFLLDEDDSKSGLSGLTAMIDSSTWHSQTPASGVVSAESDWPEPEPFFRNSFTISSANRLIALYRAAQSRKSADGKYCF